MVRDYWFEIGDGSPGWMTGTQAKERRGIHSDKRTCYMKIVDLVADSDMTKKDGTMLSWKRPYYPVARVEKVSVGTVRGTGYHMQTGPSLGRASAVVAAAATLGAKFPNAQNYRQ